MKKAIGRGLVCLFLLGGVVLLINVQAQAPKEAKIAFVTNRDGNFEIYVMDVDGKNQKNITNHPLDDLNPDWSPDGKKIAFERSEGVLADIYVMDADGSNIVRLTNNSSARCPAWSPDGSKIAFAFWDDIYIMDADGRNQKNLTNQGVEVHDPAWSPDGSLIAFVTYKDGNFEIYVMDTSGENRRNLTKNQADDYHPSWSPNGKKIAFTRRGKGGKPSCIYIMDENGRNQRRLSKDERSQFPSWSPDGSKIVYSSEKEGRSSIYIMDAETGEVLERLTDLSADEFETSWLKISRSINPSGKLKTTWGMVKDAVYIHTNQPQQSSIRVPLYAIVQ